MSKVLTDKCWWCGEIANSREHIFKKSILKKQYGLKNYGSIMKYNGVKKRIQGPSQNELKFKPNLCKKCNNDRSSEFDKVYDEFLSKIEERFIQFYNEKQINWFDIFNSEWRLKKKLLLKYFVKHIGCRLSHDNKEFSSNLSDYLDDKDELTDLKIILEIRINNMVLTEISKQEHGVNFETLRVGKLHGININGVSSALFSWYTTGWFSMNYICAPSIRKKTDSLITPFLISEKNSGDKLENLTYEQVQDELELFDKSASEEIIKKYFDKLIKTNSM
jgi:hypothetical protein